MHFEDLPLFKQVINMEKGKLIIVSAPSGSGKSTIVNWLMQEHPELQLSFSISCTSRAPRGQEQDGVEYYFISADRFRELIAQDAFVEYEEVYQDRFYGTLKSEVERIWGNGHVIVFDVDVKGGVNLKKYFGDAALSVLIVPPSMEVLESRLRGRGTDSEEAILERLAKAASELDFARGKFDFELVNDKLEDTFRIAEETVNAFLCG
jgi:guanylate kinase